MTLRSTHGTPGLADYALEWALVDVETSGLRPGQHRVLSVAAITIDPSGRQTGEFSTLLDPGCDPGPVHVHGLTAERLRGAPAFEQVAGRLAEMLDGRVMVAHNAQFDYDFLAHEFALSRSWLPVSQRLCTLALNRRLEPPTEDMKLGTLAAHYGVPQRRAHDALDDTRVLAGVLRSSLVAAERLGLPLPLVACPPRQVTDFRPRVPKTPCSFRNPGRLPANGPLTQGMKVALTGETALSREELVARAVAAGLNVMTSVSRHSSALVSNDPGSGSAKARRAVAEGVPVIDESSFLGLLGDVRPGTPHGAPQPATAERAPVRAAEVTFPEVAAPPRGPGGVADLAGLADTAGVADTEGIAPVRPEPDWHVRPSLLPAPRPPLDDSASRPLAGRRVLILGGTHPQAVAARTRVVELGGAAAVNLSASVTDVVVFPGGEADRRHRRIVSLEMPVHDSEWLDAPVVGPRSAERLPAALVLPRGGVIDLPGDDEAGRWTVTASWGQLTACEVDAVAFVLDGDDQVSSDQDFVFYGAPETPDGAVRLSANGPSEQAITLDLAALPAAARKVVIAAAIDGAAVFGEVGAIEISAARGSSARPIVQAALDAATTERTLLLAEIYRRGPSWRFRAVGQGYDHGLDAMARDHGVDVEP